MNLGREKKEWSISKEDDTVLVFDDVHTGCSLRLMKKQMALLLGRHQVFLDMSGVEKGDKLAELNSNSDLHSYFHSLVTELDILEPKTPEAIYKSHLEQARSCSFILAHIPFS